MAVNQSQIEKEWKGRGFSCNLWTDPPGQKWEDYVHDVDELAMIIDGEVEFEINGEILRPGPGEELLIPKGITHSVRNVGHSTSRWLYGYQRK